MVRTIHEKERIYLNREFKWNVEADVNAIEIDFVVDFVRIKFFDLEWRDERADQIRLLKICWISKLECSHLLCFFLTGSGGGRSPTSSPKAFNRRGSIKLWCFVWFIGMNIMWLKYKKVN